MRQTSLGTATLSFLLLPFLATPFSTVSASPVSDSPPTAIHVPLTRRAGAKTVDDFVRQAEHMRLKYGGDASLSKRQSSVGLTNQQNSKYYGTIKVGTPAVDYSVILDTGSSDLLLATGPCSGCTGSTPLYTRASSTTSKELTTPFSILYGSGSASGTLASDVVSIGGYAVQSQTFAACTTLNGIVSGSISGLLGLGFQRISSSGAVPLVQQLAESSTIPTAEFGFAFQPYSLTETAETAPGGTLTVGGTNTSQYSGLINWIDIVQPEGYWSIPLQGVSVGSTSLGLTATAAVIDTGTSLIGAPEAAVSAIYAAIPGSKAITLSGASGYYSYPCDSSPQISFQFGGQSYAVTSDNFNAGAVDASGSTCLGSVFVLPASPTLSWIFGDAFLVNVYSAYRFGSTPAVGFATLGSGGTVSTTESKATSSAASSRLTPAAGFVFASLLAFTGML